MILSDGGKISAEDIDGGNQTKREKPLEEVQTLDETLYLASVPPFFRDHPSA